MGAETFRQAVALITTLIALAAIAIIVAMVVLAYLYMQYIDCQLSREKREAEEAGLRIFCTDCMVWVSPDDEAHKYHSFVLSDKDNSQ